jgi:hypothetical protein
VNGREHEEVSRHTLLYLHETIGLGSGSSDGSSEVIHYWASGAGWDCFANHYPSWNDSPPAEVVTWMSVAPALRHGWEDSILHALPPSPLQ